MSEERRYAHVLLATPMNTAQQEFGCCSTERRYESLIRTIASLKVG